MENRQLTRLHEPLPIPEQPWMFISMYFIGPLPKSEGFRSIMVVIDCFLKYGTLHEGVRLGRDDKGIFRERRKVLGDTV